MKKKNNDKRENRKAVTEPTVSKFKGKPILTLPLGNGFDFTFGVTKAEAILEHLDHVKRFVKEYGNEYVEGEVE